jgi:hypothetical protein
MSINDVIQQNKKRRENALNILNKSEKKSTQNNDKLAAQGEMQRQHDTQTHEYASKAEAFNETKRTNERTATDHKIKVWLARFLMIYLCSFTFVIFNTVRKNSTTFYLDKTTLNLLITFGFAKVVGLIAIVVKHFFPIEKNFKNNKI